MTQKRKTSDTGPHRGTGIGPSKRRPAPSSPSGAEKAGKRPAGPPGPAGARRQPEPSEDFGRRRDIETADEPVEQHDRRYHDRGGADVESS